MSIYRRVVVADSPGTLLLPRRQFTAGAVATIASVALPAEAVPSGLILAAKFLGGVVAGWAIQKGLDIAVEKAQKPQSVPDISKVSFDVEPDHGSSHQPPKHDQYRVKHQPEAIVSTDTKKVQGRLSDSAARHALRSGHIAPNQYIRGGHVIPNAFFSAMQQRHIPIVDAFSYWGAPSTEALKRELPDGGEILGQWWINHHTGTARYVLMRTFGDNGRRSHFIPYLNESAGVAEGVVVYGNPPSRTQMRKLIQNPEAFEPDAADIPGHS